MNVGFLGLGAMGSRMAAQLAVAGHQVTAWNRSPVEPPAGVTLVDDPAAVGKACRAAFVVVGGPTDVDDVVFGPNGWAEGAAEGSVLIQATTVGPSAVRSLAQRLAERGLRLIDAPVGGSTGPAAAGQLVVLAGGDGADIAEVQPLLDAIGSRTVHLGAVGTGSAVKLMLNAVLLSALATAAEMWAWIADAYPEIDLEQVAGAVERISPMVAARLPDIAGDPIPPGFAIRHAGKDMRLAADEVKITTLLPSLVQALADAEAAGYGDTDVAALGRHAQGRRTGG